MINRGNCPRNLFDSVAMADEIERANMKDQFGFVSGTVNRDVDPLVGLEREPRGSHNLLGLSPFGQTGRKPTNNGQALSARRANTLLFT